MEDAASDSVGNLPEFSVGEISLAVKRTVESNFERVRVRGEVSRPMRAGSGRFSDIIRENWPLFSPTGRSASSKRRARDRAARWACRHRQVSRTCKVVSNGTVSRFDMFN